MGLYVFVALSFAHVGIHGRESVLVAVTLYYFCCELYFWWFEIEVMPEKNVRQVL